MKDGVEELMDVLEPFYEMEEDADQSVEEHTDIGCNKRC